MIIFAEQLVEQVKLETNKRSYPLTLILEIFMVIKTFIEIKEIFDTVSDKI
jgi:hypothetical protein